VRESFVTLQGTTPGTTQGVRVVRFGAEHARPHIYLQAALHADELPGVWVLHALLALLRDCARQGQILGAITVVPFANPIGLNQRLLGQHHGRFLFDDGVNFNRSFVDLAALMDASKLRMMLGTDAGHNAEQVRAHLGARLAEQPQATTPVASLKRTLLGLALEADVVLDLHCDDESVMHLYTHTYTSDAAMVLARFLSARAVLTAEESGDHPFDEAVSRPWAAARSAADLGHPIAMPLAVTVELRGATDVSPALAQGDAEMLVQYLRHRGALTANGAVEPAPLCVPTPLAGVEPIVAPHAGVLAFRAEVGGLLKVGDPVCDLLDPAFDTITTVYAGTAGVMFARSSARFAVAGQRVAKIAGSTAFRTGKLLGA
jgi:uncharacterized protein